MDSPDLTRPHLVSGSGSRSSEGCEILPRSGVGPLITRPAATPAGERDAPAAVLAWSQSRTAPLAARYWSTMPLIHPFSCVPVLPERKEALGGFVRGIC